MPQSTPRFALLLLLAPSLAFAATNPAQRPLEIRAEAQSARVDLLRDEIKETDARIEARLDRIIDALKAIGDTKDSRTKVARMKEETGQRLVKSIDYYARKRAALQEELRNPRLHLTPEEKRKMIEAFDAKIEKRAQQVLALNRSMPAYEEHERYQKSDGGWWGTDYSRNEAYQQNRRMSSHADTQRDAIMRLLDKSIDRLDRQRRSLQMERDATTDPAHRKTLSDELAKTEALLAERRQQRAEALKPTGAATRGVSQKEAIDLDKALQSATADLRRDFESLFQRYNTLLVELSSLRDTEAALEATR